MTKPQIALIVGSTRPGRFADQPAGWLQELAQQREDFQLQVLDLRDYPLPFFEEASPPAAVPPSNVVALEWAKALSRCDGFIFLTPEYNHGPPAVLKNALDCAYKEWGLKPAAFVGYGALGAARSIQVLRLTVVALRMASISKAVHLGAEFSAIRGGKEFSEFPQLEKAAEAMFDELVLWTQGLRAMRERG